MMASLGLVDGVNELVIVKKDDKIIIHYHTNLVKDGFMKFVVDGIQYECDVDAVLAKSVKIGAVVVKDC
jgi:hypothetical protein